MNHPPSLKKKKTNSKPHPKSAFSFEDNYGRESSFETIDGKVQCLETTGQNIFLHPTVHCCNTPVLFHFLSHVQNMLPK